MWRHRYSAVAIGISAIAFATPVYSVENGAGFYLLGSHGPMVGLLPPPGLYFQNDVYYLSGTIGASRTLPLNGRLVADVKTELWAIAPTLLWSTPVEILGGNLALSATLPIGGPSVDAGVTLAAPALGAVISRNIRDSIFTIGDPVLGATIGWHAGNFHWNIALLVNTPIGDYRAGALANIAFHRWAEDVSFALTWFDPKIGLDLSGSVGLTFNQENPTTQYRSGTEFHLEAAVVQHFARDFAAGLVGYYYQQVSADSGSGARLGSYMGRVAAIGLYGAYTFNLEGRPITASAKVFKEFAAENRLDNGVAAYLTIALPLTMTHASAAKPISARY